MNSHAPRASALRWIHALTILLGAFLLFLVQPLTSRRLLPGFGGGAEVWTVCLLFFQTALFAGYAYAHLNERILPRALRPIVHGALILGSAALAIFGPPEAGRPVGESHPTARILLALALSVGAPYFVLSSTGPLVQAWSSRADPDRSPYRLYALSNVGSLAALLAYPFLFEPFSGLKTQAAFWKGGFLVFAGLYALATAMAARGDTTGAPIPAVPAEPPPGRGRIALWVALPAFASWMLVASTNQLCQDLVVVPFLWVLPLAAYLLSFIVAFDHPRWYRPAWIAPVTAALLFLAAGAHLAHARFARLYGLGIAVSVASLFFLSLLCHGELARLKPSPRHLTSYYLALSGGGALGGAFVSLVAPRIFSTFFEWKLGVGIGFVVAWIILAWTRRDQLRAHLNVVAILVVVAGLGLAFIGAFLASYSARLETARNFYGVVAVEESPGGEVRDMVNGRILHGRQYLGDGDRPKPSSYYAEGSGVGRAFRMIDDRDDLRAGVVGLGVGTLAAYLRRPRQSVRFYEINPDVTRLAKKYFTYLKDCRGRVDVVPGDARLSLEREPPRGFHLLALDAFSGDTVPTHLLTLEAMQLYVSHLAPDGMLAIHVSNHYLDLAPVVRGAARRLGLRCVDIDVVPEDRDRSYSSRWIVCARREDVWRELKRFESRADDGREVLWTDDRADLFSVLKLRQAGD